MSQPGDLSDVPHPPSRPLSEISENSNTNSDRRRSIRSPKPASRPVSEVFPVREANDENEPPEGTMEALIEVQTISVDLAGYEKRAAKEFEADREIKAPKEKDALEDEAPRPPSPSTKPQPLRSFTTPASAMPRQVSPATDHLPSFPDTPPRLPQQVHDETEAGMSPLYVSKRASLRPSPLNIHKFEPLVKSAPVAPPMSLNSSRSSVDSNSRDSHGSAPPAVPPKPAPKSKPSWLRRPSAAPFLRGKSPLSAGDASSPQPPSLPPRRGTPVSAPVTTSMGPPDLPQAGPSRLSSFPEERGGSIRSRIAAWSAAAQPSSLGRSESSYTLSNFISGHSRNASSAARLVGNAGSAVQKGWAGIRSARMPSSISSMGGLRASESRTSLASSQGPSPASSAADHDSRGDGPVFEEGVIRRRGRGTGGRVFGRDLVETGRTWSVVDATEAADGVPELETRRRQCLPAIVVRSVDYLEIWGPKEEGIFRISGRSSHITRLRKEFDSGADLDMSSCHPGDLDPHAVAGVFKSYLRELPGSIFTEELHPQFDAWTRSPRRVARIDQPDDPSETLEGLLQQLPAAHWFLLADIAKLLDLIPRHAATNRMTLNALMLSLGPSLNAPGVVITELIAHRSTLFARPPSPDFVETAANLIDFGDVDIAPPALLPTDEDSRPITPVTIASTEDGRKPSILHKASLPRLFGALRPESRKPSIDTLSSTVDAVPPRVELPLDSTPPLPTFEVLPKSAPPFEASFKKKRSMGSLAGPASISDDSYRRDSAASTTSEDAPLSSPTPIADKFSGTSPKFDLRPKPDSPASGGPPSPNRVRRSPGYFGASMPVHTRSLSASKLSGSSTTLAKVMGMDEEGADGLEKRRSVKEMVRAMDG